MAVAYAGITGGEAYYLHPGDVVLGWRGARLTTLLGSCVAVILTDAARTAGAMCHIVHSGVHGSPSPGVALTSMADPAIDAMYGLLRGVGLTPTLCEAFLFGGGNLLPAAAGRACVGCSNVQVARRRLAADGIPIVGEDVGGAVCRKVRWVVGPQAPRVGTTRLRL